MILLCNMVKIAKVDGFNSPVSGAALKEQEGMAHASVALHLPCKGLVGN